MRWAFALLTAGVLGGTAGALPQQAESPARPGVQDAAATRSRQPVDTIGFTHSAAGICKVIDHATALEAERLADVRGAAGWGDATALIGGISPHDDYGYAQLLPGSSPRAKILRAPVPGDAGVCLCWTWDGPRALELLEGG
ncbi:MAG: hypothetical protein AB1486_16970 [Planctomycetota bacterium]